MRGQDHRQLALQYYVKSRGEHSDRLVSPQMVVHYRGNWYLIAWCHLRSDLRSFALDSIECARLIAVAAHEVDLQTLSDFVGQGYGIFSGGQVQWARLRFSAARARWVARESWHPNQELHWLSSGELEMGLPFTDLRELTMDVLRHGAHVEVLEPDALRASVASELYEAANRYIQASAAPEGGT